MGGHILDLCGSDRRAVLKKVMDLRGSIKFGEFLE